MSRFGGDGEMGGVVVVVIRGGRIEVYEGLVEVL